MAGEFDGMHRGHVHLVAAARAVAEREGGPLIGVVLAGWNPFPHLLPVEARLEALLGAGCARAVAIDRAAAASDLAERIVAGCDPARVVLSCPPAGRVQMAYPPLRAGFAAHGIEVVEVDRLRDAGGTVITSAAIRATIAAGDVALAAEWVGRPYTVRGVVVHGAKLGRTIGFPTANLDPPVGLAVPCHGVYAAWVTTAAGSEHAAAVNVGVRPTVAKERRLMIEAHLLDFDADIYDEPIGVRFLHRLRGEQRFESLDALVAQVRDDVRAVAEQLGGAT